MEWIDGNIGSRLTMKYPAVYMVGPEGLGRGALGGLRRRRPAPGRRRQDGARRARDHLEDRVEVDLQGRRPHAATAAWSGSRTTPTAARATCSATPSSSTRRARSDTFPYMEVGARDAVIGHEATVSKVADEQLFYLMSRGLSEEQAMGMVVNGFIEPVTRTLPDGVRRRVEPPDRAPDGGLGRLTAGRLTACRRTACRRTACPDALS